VAKSDKEIAGATARNVVAHTEQIAMACLATARNSELNLSGMEPRLRPSAIWSEI
jgi:hypothetical protein